MTQPAIPIAPSAYSRPGVGPGVILMLTALGLILLGGCFLIGVMTCNNPNGPGGAPPATPYVMPSGLYILQIVLYIVAFACFAGATFLIAVGVKWLHQIMK